MDDDEPVWITGVGAATPLGCDLAEIESNLLAGRSGVSLVTRFPTDDYPSRIAAQLGEIPAPPGCDPAAFAARARLEQLAHWCAEAALRDAGLWGWHREARVGPGAGPRGRVDVPVGDRSSRGGTRLYDPDQDRESTIERTRSGTGALRAGAGALGGVRQRQPRAGDRPPLAPARPGGRLRGGGLRPGRHADRPGDVRQPAGPVAAELRSRRRRRGRSTAAATASSWARAAWRSCWSDRGDARRRRADAYAEVAGCGSSSDAHHHVIPSPDPAPAVAAMRQALADARSRARRG